MERIELGPPHPSAVMRLAELHAALEVGAHVHLDTTHWSADLADAVVVGAGFGPGTEGATSVRLRTLPDYLGAGLRLMLVGLNPSLFAADAGVGFARPGNRFWPAALAAGLVSIDRDPRHALYHHGVGFTDLAKRATARADQLDQVEYKIGFLRIERIAAWLEPQAICFVGLSGYRAAADKKASTGWQQQRIAGRPVYVMPNPSGLNAHATPAALAEHLRAASRTPR